jgi:octanoyl-[GcvH]:protein N-octanoyltransferase
VDARDDERRRQVRARLLRPLRLLTDSFPDNPALDTAVSRALLERVAAGELPETLRLARPGAMVAFGKQDAVASGYPDAARAARNHGFEAILRLAGGRAAVFHEETLAIAHALPGEDLRSGVHDRFREAADRIAAALRALEADARVGEVPGEYCPGGYSVNARGETKVAGVGQRLIRGGAHLGAVVVAADADRVREPLVPVYSALGLDWDPATTGSVADEVPGVGLDEVIEAIRAEYARDYELIDAELDEQTLVLARRLAPEHASP